MRGASNPLFFLYYLKNDRGYSRFAVSVNRKIGNAVERNYIKRRMKEFFRINQSLLNRPHDVWVSIKMPFDHSRSTAAETQFIDGLVKINYTP
jgi:ribonuclease P protein component